MSMRVENRAPFYFTPDSSPDLKELLKDPKQFAAFVARATSHNIQKTAEISELLGEKLLAILHSSQETMEDEDLELAKSILHANISHLVEPNGPYGLGRILVHAAADLHPEIVHAILAHPQAQHIKKSSWEDVESTLFEKVFDIKSSGWEEALFALVWNNERDIPNQTHHIRVMGEKIISFASTLSHDFCLEGNFGIYSSFFHASGTDEDLARLLLKIPGCDQIVLNVADEEEPSLGNALLDAAFLDFSKLVSDILQLPNAQNIEWETLNEAKQRANREGYQETSFMILSFMQAHFD